MVHPATHRSHALIAGLFSLLSLTWTATLAAKPEPEFVVAEENWDAMLARYGDRYGAVAVEKHRESRIITSHRGDPSTKTVESVVYAVFDADDAQDILNQTLYLGPGVKLKGIDVWSHELGSGNSVTWAQGKDIHKRKMFGGWREVRFAFPGLSRAGVVGYELRTEEESTGLMSYDFRDRVPVLEGRYTFKLARVEVADKDRVTAIINTLFHRVIDGPIEADKPKLTGDGYTMVWRARDVDPAIDEPFLVAADTQPAHIFFIPKWYGWESIVDSYAEILAGEKAPPDWLNAARDSLGSASTEAIVHAVARYLDDPSVFDWDPEVRSGGFGSMDVAGIAAEREGDAHAKATLAHVLLRDLGVDNTMLLGASRYTKDLDWRVVDFSMVDATLLWIPELGSDYVWDVADLSVPIGSAGSELYPEMVVVDPERQNPVSVFDTWPSAVNMSRTFRWALDEDGLLAGSVTARFEGWPPRGLDPWDPAQDTPQVLAASAPHGLTVTHAAWEAKNPGMIRCTRADPAVLRCSLETEATPVGEAGWEIRPLYEGLPWELASLAEGTRTLPVSILRGYELADTITVETGTLDTDTLPDFVQVKNPAGRFRSYWRKQDEGFGVIRTLVLYRQRAETSDEIGAIQELCRAWEASRDQALVVE